MKNFLALAVIVAALIFAQRSCAPLNERVATPARSKGVVADGADARQWQQAPNAVMDMQDAMGGGSAGPAHAARDAVTKQLGR